MTIGSFFLRRLIVLSGDDDGERFGESSGEGLRLFGVGDLLRSARLDLRLGEGDPLGSALRCFFFV